MCDRIGPVHRSGDPEQANPPERTLMALENDTLAPDFELANQFGELVRLSQFRGSSAVALVFFPLAFSGAMVFT